MNDSVSLCYVVFPNGLELKFDVVSIYLLEGLWGLGALEDICFF